MCPNDTHLRTVQARDQIERSNWDRAAALYAEVIENCPPSEEWYEHAGLRLMVGDKDGYAAVSQPRRPATESTRPTSFHPTERCSKSADELQGDRSPGSVARCPGEGSPSDASGIADDIVVTYDGSLDIHNRCVAGNARVLGSLVCLQ